MPFQGGRGKENIKRNDGMGISAQEKPTSTATLMTIVGIILEKKRGGTHREKNIAQSNTLNRGGIDNNIMRGHPSGGGEKNGKKSWFYVPIEKTSIPDRI